VRLPSTPVVTSTVMGAPSKLRVKLDAPATFGACTDEALAAVPPATSEARPMKALAVMSALLRMDTSLK